MIDVIDCSGSGDVKMYGPEVAEVGSDGVPVLRAKSGRSLRLNPSWPNPSGEWFLGSKVTKLPQDVLMISNPKLVEHQMAFELYPVTLEKRVRAARRDEWMKRHRQVRTELLSGVKAPDGHCFRAV